MVADIQDIKIQVNTLRNHLDEKINLLPRKQDLAKLEKAIEALDLRVRQLQEMLEQRLRQ